MSGMDSAPGSGAAAPPSMPELERLGLHDAVELARGGFGIVFKAHQPALNRAVAVKVMTTEVRDEMTRVRFERECKAMGMLSDHPGIVTVFDAGFTHLGRPFIVMDLMTNGALSDRLDRDGPFPWREVLSIAVKICGALETAHRAGILHRDIKPENIMTSEYGEPKLGDFGIARLQGGQETRTGTLTASIAHVAPELLSGEPPSVRTDLYALGSTMFSLLSGESAYLRETDESIVPALTRITAEPVPDLRPRGVPDNVCRLVERLMAKDPQERYASAEEAAVAMQQLQRTSGVSVTTLRIPDLPLEARAVIADLGATNTVNVPALPGAATAPTPTPATTPTTETPVEHGHAPQTDRVPSPPALPVEPVAKKRRSMVLVAAGIVLALVAGGVAMALTRQQPPAVDQVQPTVGAPGGGGGPPVAGEGTEVDTGQLAKQVAEIRDLQILAPIDARRLSRQEYDPLIRQWSVAGREEELATQGRVLTALGLLPADADLVTLTQDLYAEQFGGFYDERRKQVNLRAESSALTALERSIVVDEVIAALLDQGFNVTQMHDDIEDADSDRALAALVKGDTYLAAAVWSERFLTSDEQEQRLADISLLPDQVARAAPEALRAELVFPFVAGEQFVRAVFDEGGVDELNKVYSRPPSTTEQVLHPQKYFRGEEGVSVPPAAAPGDGWEELTSRTFGEFDMQQLTARLGTEKSEAAGDGWGGGRLTAWGKGDQTAVAVSLVFDTARDGRQACSAIREWFTSTALRGKGDGGNAAGRAPQIRCMGGAVAFAVAPDEGTAQGLLPQ